MSGYCKSGKHYWLSDDSARKCCNGFKRVLDVKPGGRYKFEWIRDVLTEDSHRSDFGRRAALEEGGQTAEVR